MTDILKKVDVLDLVNINVYTPNVYKPGDLSVEIEAIEKGKVVVIDSEALSKFNNIITEKCKEFEDARDPKVKEFIKEFTGRMCSEWHNAGLLVLDDAPEGPIDHYEEARKAVKDFPS